MSEFLGLDRIDLKVLSQLDLDSRRSASEISKNLKLPRHVVNYRIKKLISDGFIRSFPAFIDPCKFGLTGWKVYLQLRGTDSKIEKEMMAFLGSSPQIWWAVKCFGAYDLLYLPLARDFYEVNKFLYEFHDRFGRYVTKEDINNHLEPIYFSRGYLSNANPSALCAPSMRKPENGKFDSVDKEILNILGSNCRRNSVEIAAAVGSTPRVVNYKIKNMLRSGVISFFRLSLNLEKFNLEFYKGLIYLSSTKENDLLSIYEYAKQSKYINECVKAVGSWQVEIELEVPNFRTFATVASDMKSKFPDLINRIEPLLLYDELKSDFNFISNLERI